MCLMGYLVSKADCVLTVVNKVSEVDSFWYYTQQIRFRFAKDERLARVLIYRLQLNGRVFIDIGVK